MLIELIIIQMLSFPGIPVYLKRDEKYFVFKLIWIFWLLYSFKSFFFFQ